MLPILIIGTALCFLIALVSKGAVLRTLAKHRRTRHSKHWTGARAAQAFLKEHGLESIDVQSHDGLFTNQYQHRNRQLLLSPAVYKGQSISHLAMATHEAAHALQAKRHLDQYAMRSLSLTSLMLLSTLVPATLLTLAALRGLPMRFALPIVLITWVVLMVSCLLTLPTEWKASRRALTFLKTQGLLRNEEEEDAFKQAYHACAWIGCAQFLRSPSWCFYHLLPLHGKKKRRLKKETAGQTPSDRKHAGQVPSGRELAGQANPDQAKLKQK